jgi:hypothetical protein
MLHENLIQSYTPTQIKCVLEHALFIKSSYSYIPVILTYKRDPVNISKRIKSTLFEINSFTDQKYEVTLLQQSLATVLTEFLPKWSIELFDKGLGIQKVADTYVVKFSLNVAVETPEKALWLDCSILRKSKI